MYMSKTINKRSVEASTLSLVTLSLLLAGAYIWSVFHFSVFETFEPQSIIDMFESYAILSLPLLLPAALIAAAIFAPILRSKSSGKDKSATFLMASLFTISIWVGYAFIFFLFFAKLVRIAE